MAFRLRPLARSRTSVLVATLMSLSTFSTMAAAADEPGSVAVPEPEPAPPTNSGAISAPPAETAVPEPAAPVPEAPAEAAEPDAQPGSGPAPSEAAPSEPAPSEPDVPAVDPSLLDAKSDEPVVARPVATRDAGRSPEEQLAAMDDAHALRYRPADNPVHINVAGRLMFANISGREHVNGRMGGGSVDVGPSWNHVGVSGTLTGFAGRVLLPPSTGAELNALVGGGLTVSLGRLALLSHGFLDLRLGYDVFYGAVNQRRDGPTILATPGDASVVAVQTESLVPHGPRARLDLGLVGAGNRRFFHGFGLSMGYQALVGSFRGEMPMTSMLTIGLSYWMG
jgi:hypothetical protein